MMILIIKEMDLSSTDNRGRISERPSHLSFFLLLVGCCGFLLVPKTVTISCGFGRGLVRRFKTRVRLLSGSDRIGPRKRKTE